MIILTAGSRVTLNLAAYNGFTVTGRNRATVLVNGVTTTVDGTTVFGLYSSATTAVITAANGDCEYDLTFPSVGEYGKTYPDPVTGQLYRWDADSGAYVGVGGISAGIRAVLIGDSYIDREMEYTVDNRTHQSSWGSIGWANFFLGNPLDIVMEMGIGGERVTDVLSRVELIHQYKPKMIFLSCAINDLKGTKNSGNSIVTGLPYATDSHQTELPYVQEKYALLLDKLSKTGAQIFVMGISAPNSTYLVKTQAQRMLKFNKWLKYMCDQSPSLKYLDVDRATYDPLVNTGEVLAGYYTTDHVHKSILGAFKAGQRIAAQLKPVLAGSLVDRLPWNMLETAANMAVVGTAAVADGTNLTITIDNLNGSFREFQVGDRVVVFTGTTGQTARDGTYTVSSVTDTSITMPCTRPASSFTGTVYVSAATQMYLDPLNTLLTGTWVTAGVTLTSGNISAGMLISGGGAGSPVSVTPTHSPHTDIDGNLTGLGEWLELEISTAAAYGYVKINYMGSTGIATQNRNLLHPGDTVNTCGDLELMASPTPTGVYQLQPGLTLNYYDAAGALISGTVETLYRSPTAVDAHPNLPFRGSYQTTDWKLPDAPLPVGTSMTVDGRILVSFGASGGTCKIRIARLGINRVDYPTRDASKAACYQ